MAQLKEVSEQQKKTRNELDKLDTKLLVLMGASCALIWSAVLGK